jgi:cytochrome c
MSDATRGQSPRETASTPATDRLDGTSPLRWLLVILPLVVIVAAGSNIAGLWTVPGQRTALQERQRSSKPEVIERAPTAGEAKFDAGAVVALLAKASPEDGALQFRMCMACHTTEKDGPHKIGPNLWGIVGQRKAAFYQYNYSAGLKAKGGKWSYGDLAEYLHDPRQFAPGTSMAFAGIPDNTRLANLIAYLRILADDPRPLPK